MDSPQSDPIPVENRAETIRGVSISVQILALLAVALRLFARSKLAHGLAVDDIFVLLACLAATAGTIIVSLQPSAGLGQHQMTLSYSQLIAFLKYSFGDIISYTLSVTFIKLSILFQYIRATEKERVLFRCLCWIMVGIVSIWGIVFFFIIIGGCVPLSGYWNPLLPARCILFGSKDNNTKLQGYVVQSASNMVLGVIVFAMPIYLLKNAKLSRRSKIGLVGVFSLGALVVIISILRLYSILEDSLGLLLPTTDATFYTTKAIIWSCIEANVAVMCASMPVFWPVLSELAFGKIVVTKEVEVRSDRRLSRLSVRSQYDLDDEQGLTQSLGWQHVDGKVEILHNG